MRILKSGLLFVVIFMASCSPKIYKSQNPPLAYSATVTVVQSQKIPEQAKKLTIISVGNYDSSVDCTYETVIETTKAAARKAGGNIIQIVEYREPDDFSTCHRITANIYKLDNVENYNLTDEMEITESLQKNNTIKIYKDNNLTRNEKTVDNLPIDTVIPEQKIEVEKPFHEKIFKDIIRFKPFATLEAFLLAGGLEIELQYARYVSNKVAVPLDVDFTAIGNKKL
ncbi:MAG: hypothetical protein LBB53_04625, partial [Prevotellaceae bacterium]|nr:hypothetical protein [Prevotellaceae bacterium]